MYYPEGAYTYVISMKEQIANKQIVRIEEMVSKLVYGSIKVRWTAVNVTDITNEHFIETANPCTEMP